MNAQGPVQRQLDAYNARALTRFVAGRVVVNHERIAGRRDEPLCAVAVYEVVDGHTRVVWLQ